MLCRHAFFLILGCIMCVCDKLFLFLEAGVSEVPLLLSPVVCSLFISLTFSAVPVRLSCAANKFDLI